MKIKVFYPNAKGNIELTKEKLEAILTEAYNEGYNDGKYHNNGFYYNTLTATTPYITTCASSASSSDIDAAWITTKGYNETATIDCALNTLEAKSIDGIKIEYVEATSEN
jgi:hypothetical protein